MANAYTGVDFSAYARVFDHYGDSVVRTPVTLSLSNVEGDETVVEGSTGSIKVYIVRKNKPWNFDAAGMIEGGDALMLVRSTDTINRHDKITWNSNTYRVQTVLNRDQIGGNVAYKACNLFLID